MHQIWITQTGTPDVLREKETVTPLPGSGEVRIRVEASGIGYPDVLGRMGLYAPAPETPFVPGCEVAGTIDALGQGVQAFHEGDKVLALTQFGGYSDVACVPYRQVFKRLTRMEARQGAALPVDYLTAFVSLVVMGALQPGNLVLIHEANSSVGLAALEICRILGATAFGTAPAHQHEQVAAHGAAYLVDIRHEDYEKAIGAEAGEKGLDVVVDTLGGEHWQKNYRLLAPAGRLIHLGMDSMADGKRASRLWSWRSRMGAPVYSPARLMRESRAVAGVNLLELIGQGERLRGWMQQLLVWYDQGLIQPKIERTFPFNKAVEAHHHLHEREEIGKVLLTF